MERISDPHEAWIAVQSRQPDASVSPGRSINSGRVGNRFVGPLPRGSARQEEDMPAGDQHGENANVTYILGTCEAQRGETNPWQHGLKKLLLQSRQARPAESRSHTLAARSTDFYAGFVFTPSSFLFFSFSFFFFSLSSLSLVPVKESPYLHLCSAFMQEIQYICMYRLRHEETSCFQCSFFLLVYPCQWGQ